MLTRALAHRLRLIYEDLIHWLQAAIVTRQWLTSCDYFLAWWSLVPARRELTDSTLKSWSPWSTIPANEPWSGPGKDIWPGSAVCDNLSVCVLCPLSQLTLNTIKIHSPIAQPRLAECCQEPGVQSITLHTMASPGPSLHTLRSNISQDRPGQNKLWPRWEHWRGWDVEITAFLEITDQHTPSPCVAPITPMVSGDNYYKYSGGDNYKYKQLKHTATPWWLPSHACLSPPRLAPVTTLCLAFSPPLPPSLCLWYSSLTRCHLRFPDYLQGTEYWKHLFQHEKV